MKKAMFFIFAFVLLAVAVNATVIQTWGDLTSNTNKSWADDMGNFWMVNITGVLYNNISFATYSEGTTEVLDICLGGKGDDCKFVNKTGFQLTSTTILWFVQNYDILTIHTNQTGIKFNQTINFTDKIILREGEVNTTDELDNRYWTQSTDQTGLTGDKTGSFGINTTGKGRFDGGVGIGVDSTSGIYINVFVDQNNQLTGQIKNPNAGTSSHVKFNLISDVATLTTRAHADSRPGTRYGESLGGATELLAIAGELLIGTLTTGKKVVIGTENIKAIEIDGSTQEVTVSHTLTVIGLINANSIVGEVDSDVVVDVADGGDFNIINLESVNVYGELNVIGGKLNVSESIESNGTFIVHSPFVVTFSEERKYMGFDPLTEDVSWCVFDDLRTCSQGVQDKINSVNLREERKGNCKSNGYSWEGECFEIVSSLSNYNEAVEIVKVPETETINTTCIGLTDTLHQVNYNCTEEVETGKTIDKYQFKENCGLNKDSEYYCKERIDKAFNESTGQFQDKIANLYKCQGSLAEPIECVSLSNPNPSDLQTRCYQNEEKSSWFNCQNGWVKI